MKKTGQQEPIDVAVRIVRGNALTTVGDALILKCAQRRFGVDRAAAKLFRADGKNLPKPEAGKAEIVRSPRGITATQTVVVGTAPYWEFGYRDVRLLSENSLSKLADAAPLVRQVVMTSHGVGFGLDPVGVFDAALTGLQSAIGAQRFPSLLNCVYFVTLTDEHFDVLRNRLRERLPSGLITGRRVVAHGDMPKKTTLDVLVAMPFEPEEKMWPVFHSINKGVRGVRTAKLTCGTVTDLAPPAGPVDIKITRIHDSIRAASYVIADITPDIRYGCSNPNVCQEVGYAWAHDIDTVLIARKGAEGVIASNFDGVVHIKYDGLKNLETQIRKTLTKKEKKRQ